MAAFLAAHPTPPAEVVLDLDATDDPVHGRQEGRFFHGYYRAYCYLPLYIFAGDFLLAAKLRTADGDGAAGAVEEVARIVARLRAAWPAVRIIVRGDSGFARDALMTWCEAHAVDYVLGLARNERLEAAITLELGACRDRLRGRAGAGTPLQGLRLPDTGELDACTAGHWEGGAPAGQGESALRRDLAARRALGGRPALRAALLCARGHGEPDQGAAARAVCRSHEHGDDARESIAAVDRECSVCAGPRAAPGRPARDGARPGAGPHDPHPSAQARRRRAGECAADCGRAQRRLPVTPPLRPGAHGTSRPPTRCAAEAFERPPGPPRLATTRDGGVCPPAALRPSSPPVGSHAVQLLGSRSASLRVRAAQETSPWRR